MQQCESCGQDISAARLEFVPDTQHCVDCIDANSEPRLARMLFIHKTAGEVVITSGAENCRRLTREYKRSR